MRGGSFSSFLKKANTWLKKTKFLSTAGKALGAAGVPYASDAGKVAGVLGYGRRRRRTVRRRSRRKGAGLRLAGAGLGLAGSGVGLAGGRRRKKRMHGGRETGISY